MRHELRKRPVGCLRCDFDGLKKAGCIQCETDDLKPMFFALMMATLWNPCYGCPVWRDKGDQCEAFRRFHSAWHDKQLERDRRIVSATGPCQKNGEKWEGYSVAKIAEELGLSKSEVRRRKVAGTLYPRG